MAINSWVFLLFSFFVLLIYWLIPRNKYRFYFLIFSTFIFIFYHFPLNLFIYLVYISLSYFLGKIIFKLKSLQSQNKVTLILPQLLLFLGIALSLFFLSYYKYEEFFLSLLNYLHINLLRTSRYNEFFAYLIPIGISFSVFEVIHYLIEIFCQRIKKTSYKDFSFFIFFFPTMVAGPIKRYNDFYKQTSKLIPPDFSVVIHSLIRILLGFAKKILIADFLIIIPNTIFPHYSIFSPAQILLAIYTFSIVIFFDFSGYSDVAIGISQLFGFKIPENFNSPYTKTNLASFWDNWHISLTRWIKDYLFIPLGGSRVAFGRYLLNILIVFGLIGLWHGASGNFVFWGIYHGIGLAIYQSYTRFSKKFLSPKKQTILTYVAGTLLTFNFVSFGWVLFRSTLTVSLLVWRQIIFSKVGAIFICINLFLLTMVIFKPSFKLFNEVDQKVNLYKDQFISLKNKRVLNVRIANWFLALIVPLIAYFTLFFFSENIVPYIYEQF